MQKNNKVLAKSQESETTQYKHLFLTERPSKSRVAVYIDKELFSKMRIVIGMSDKANLTNGSFVSAVLEAHFEEYGEVITELFKEHQEQMISKLGF